MTVRLRFAPSPTGDLHIGGARTALFNWALARKMGGAFILRIEDTDSARSTAEYEAVILRELKWCGLDWDESVDVGGPYGPYRQTERMGGYAAAAADLLHRGTAYRCTCSRERLDALRADQEARKTRPGYDGHCRDLGLGADCGPHVVRLRVGEGKTIVDDLIKGPVVYDNAEIDDLILVRTDGMPTYNFVVVLDDVAMKMTHVLRGDEHLNNTPKQLLIYKALGAEPPRFGHVPLILGKDGSKMSKRDGATSVAVYRELGMHPEALMNYLARLGWSQGDEEVYSLAAFIQAFSLEGIGLSGSKWDIEKLTSVNAHWMRHLPIEIVVDRARPFFEARGLTLDERFSAVITAMRERTKTLVELADACAFFFQADDAVKRDPAAVTEILVPSAAMLSDLAGALADVEWTEAALEPAVHAFCVARELKLGKVAQPVRVALSGQKVGPGLFVTLVLVGKETALRRLRSAAAASA